MLTWKREERASRRWWFEGVQWQIGAAAALGRSGLPGLDSGGGGDEGGDAGVGFEEGAETRRMVAVAKSGSDCSGGGGGEKVRSGFRR